LPKIFYRQCTKIEIICKYCVHQLSNKIFRSYMHILLFLFMHS